MAVRLSPVPVLCRTRLAAWLLVLLTLFATGCQASPRATPSPAFFPETAQDGGTIALSLEDGTIWLLVGDEPPRFLAHGDVPKLSPDGCAVAFLRQPVCPPPKPEYWVIDLDDASPARLLLPRGGWGSELVYGWAWSPDSGGLAITNGGDIKRLYHGNLRWIDASDGTATDLTESGAGEPQFSPDSQWIATTTPEIGYTHGSVGLWHREDGSGETLFVPLWRHSLEWARDSSGFAAAINSDGDLGMKLWWVPVDGDPVQLGHLPDAMHVLWQPGAEWLAYSSAYSDYGIRLLRRDGSGDGAMPGSEDMNPSSWSPDGRWLLTQGQDGHTYIVDIQAMHAPRPLDVGRVHGWLDATHYIASTERAGHTELYRCVVPQACQSLAQFPGPISRLSLTGRRCPDVRWEAIGDPGPFDLEEGVPVLIEALLEHPELRVRGDAAYRLGWVGPREGVVPALVQAMEDDPHMRCVVGYTLGRIGPAAMEGVPALIEALEDDCAAETRDACSIEQTAVIMALLSIGCQGFGADASAWRTWWEAQGAAYSLPVRSFTAGPNPVERGSAVTLSWDVTGATGVSIWHMTYDRKIGQWYRVGKRIYPPRSGDSACAATGHATVPVPGDARYPLRFELEATLAPGTQVAAVSEVVHLKCHSPIARSVATLGRCLSAVQAIQASYQPFERGHLVWRADTQEILILSTHETYHLPWSLEPPIDQTQPLPAVPQGLYAPAERFAGLWSSASKTVGVVGAEPADQPTIAVSEILGWATGPEQTYTMRLQLDLDPAQRGYVEDRLVLSLPGDRLVRLVLTGGANAKTGPAWYSPDG